MHFPSFFRPSLIALLVVPLLYAQSSQQQIRNLRAFTKAYGCVKYFHPSDEAADLDWNRFAAYAAATVKRAKNPQSLRAVLTKLFSPIAPTARFHGSGEPANLPQLTFTNDQAVVAWQHYGDGQDTESANSIYKSIRVNRKPLRPATVFGAVMSLVDAMTWRGLGMETTLMPALLLLKTAVVEPCFVGALYVGVTPRFGGRQRVLLANASVECCSLPRGPSAWKKCHAWIQRIAQAI